MANILEAENIKKVFGIKKHPVTVLDNVSLKIPKREFTVIMGSSGSGKSTLLYVLSGMDNKTTGTVRINGNPITKLSEKKLADLRRNKIGFVFQDHNLISSLTLKENILIAGYLSSSKRKKTCDRANQLMLQLNIKEIENRLPTEVSGGQKQRCAIARALINNPDIVFADEPTGNLNSKASQEVMKCLVSLKSQGQSILMVTHDTNMASYGDHIHFMQDGNIIDDLVFGKNLQQKQRQQQLLTWLKDKNW